MVYEMAPHASWRGGAGEGGAVRRVSKPIRVFFSPLSQRFFATRAYREIAPGQIEATGERFDVTDDIAGLIEQHGVTFTKKVESS